MAHRYNESSPERLRRTQAWVDDLGILWDDVRTPVSGSVGTEDERQQLETSWDEEEDMYPPQEMEQAPFPYDERGPQPWGFPPAPELRLSQPRELTNLKFPNDVPVETLERMKNRAGLKRYVSYPTRLFHLRPQSNLTVPEDLDWENAFLWQKVSSSRCKADWIQDFPYPALDMALPYFPEAILRHGMSFRMSKATENEALEFAAAVFNSTARGPSDPEPDFNVEWKDIRSMARSLVTQLERHGSRRATDMAVEMREHQKAMRDYNSFFRFRDSHRKPTGMGFRGSRDIFFLDDDFVTDFLDRAGQYGAPSVRMRSDVKLIPFLNSPDAAKVTILMVSAQAFREPRKRTHLCYAIARTFPNLESLRLTSIGTVGDETAARWEITPEFWFRTGDFERLAEEEIRRNGGSSYIQGAREDAQALFELSFMSPALIRATGAYADGRGRSLAGEPSRTPLVAFGISAGLLHDPEPAADQQLPADQGGQDPPFIAAVQHMLTAAFRVMARRREAAAQATRAEALAKLEGRRTMLPRPVVGGPAWGFWSADRLYRPSEARLEDFRWLAQEHIAREHRRHACADPEHVSSETEPESAHPVPAVDIGPWTREYARVEATVLVYDRDAYDNNVCNGWTGFGPGVDLSYFP